MHDEWLSASGDGEDGLMTGLAPESSPPWATRQPAAPIAVGGEQGAVPTEPSAGGAEATVDGPTALEDGSVGEEEAHRSAVDAVDGLLDEVELALARLDDGTYGRCDSCGAVIGDARLAESPIVRSCGPCGTGSRPELAHAAVGPVDPSGTTDPGDD